MRVRSRAGQEIAMLVAALTAAGLALSIPCTLAATGFLQTMLYGVEAGDPWSLGAASALLTTTALVAGFLPAPRAAALDPLTTLRES